MYEVINKGLLRAVRSKPLFVLSDLTRRLSP